MKLVGVVAEKLNGVLASVVLLLAAGAPNEKAAGWSCGKCRRSNWSVRAHKSHKFTVPPSPLTCAVPICPSIFFASGSSLFTVDAPAAALLLLPPAAAPNENILGACTLLAAAVACAPKANGVDAVAAGTGAGAAAMPPNGDAVAAGAPKPPKVGTAVAAVGFASVWPNWN